jgi:hypothetical protein
VSSGGRSNPSPKEAFGGEEEDSSLLAVLPSDYRDMVVFERDQSVGRSYEILAPVGWLIGYQLANPEYQPAEAPVQPSTTSAAWAASGVGMGRAAVGWASKQTKR